MKLRDYQMSALERLREKILAGRRSVILWSPTGCHAPGTPILKADGSVVPVETVRVGDQVMGPDSRPRNVIHQFSGADEMVRIVPTKGEPFTVNVNHILTLQRTNDGPRAGEIIDISVADYLRQCRTFKHIFKLFRVPVEFANTDSLPIDPYFLGVVLGDGTIRRGGISVSKPDYVINETVLEQSFVWNLQFRFSDHKNINCKSVVLSGGRCHKHRGTNLLYSEIEKLGLSWAKSGTKFIPFLYKTSTRENRLQILAGLLDTDGHMCGCGFDFISKSRMLADDTAFLARSVGLAAYVRECRKGCQTGAVGTYHRVSISGDCSVIPTKIPRKQAPKRKQIKDHLRTGFSVVPMGPGQFYGFAVDGDHRYLMGDFTVLHNSGKTVMASEIVSDMLSGGVPALFLAHRKELIDQAHNKLEAFGIPHGIIMAGHPTDSTAPVQVASVQTLIRRECPITPGMIIVDEVHHVAAASYRKILDQFPDAFILGLTATPFRTDGKGLGDVFEDWILVDSVANLTEKGYLVPARYWSAGIPDLRGVRRKGGDWDPESLAERLGRPKLVGNVVDHYLMLAKGRFSCGKQIDRPRFICFCVNQNHSREMAAAFSAKGIPAVHLGDDTPKREREDILAAHVAGQILGICNVNILSEGYDSPTVSTCILARPTLSLGMHLQQIGRVLRPAPGKDCAYVLDHAGNCRRHGLATDPMEVDLTRGTIERAEGDAAPALRTCAQCFAILPASVQTCPLCGSELGKPPKTIVSSDGTLQEITKPVCACGSFETTKKAHPMHGTGLYCSKCGKWIRWIGKQQAPAEFLRDRVRICQEKGFKPGWAFKQFQIRFGRWPSDYEKCEATA